VHAWLLTFHFVGMVMWLGGFFALVRVLGYHAVEPPSVRPTLRRIEWRANYLFAWPGAILVVATGAMLVRAYGYGWLRVSLWMQAKLALVGVLLLVHLGVSRTQRRIARLDLDHPLARGWSAISFLLLLLMIAITALSVHKPFVGGAP
jgi:putative membrane protein